MKTARLLWFLLMVVLAVGLSVASIFWPGPEPAVYAQRPTPTNESPGGPGGGGLGAEGPSHRGSVSGIVFNYSAGQPQGGIGVVLEGDGWAAEAVSESDGGYAFRGLGTGSATLRLRLPEGATPVNPDLLVYTSENSDTKANLGYYTGDPSPLPVLLTAAYAPVEGAPGQLALSFQVENRGAMGVTGVVVDAHLPAGQQIMSAQVSQGRADAAGLRAQVRLGNLDEGRKASINLLLNLTSPEASKKGARAILTYDQQVTSQIVGVATSRSGTVKMPVTGEVILQDPLSYSLLVALLIVIFGCTAVLMARSNHQR